MHLDGSLQLTLGQASYAGLKELNEDSIGMSMPTGQALVAKGAVAMIADGTSVGETGKEASDTCVTSFLSDYYSTPDSWSVQKSAQQVLYALNRWLWGQGQAYIHAKHGYVCTLSLAIFKSHTAHIFHVGNSRIYRMRSGELELLTRDHAVDSDTQEIQLNRAMGMHSRVEIDYQAVDIAEGDVFFLSTGGLHNHIEPKDICARLQNLEEGAEQACSDLIALALEGQSGENLSCQIIRVDALPDDNVNAFSSKLTELPFPPALEAGSELDGFTIESEIKASRRSRLYVVRNSAGERYVLKAPLVKYAEDAAYIENFLMESWIGARVNSPYVLKSASVARRKRYLYHITEYIDGVSLQQWMRSQGAINTTERLDLIEQISKGLTALHRNDIIHRDLTPESIIVSAKGQVKIVDLGSCLVGAVEENTPTSERAFTQASADYAAPELKQGKAVSIEADQFSLAVMAYELITGEKPFAGKLAQASANSEHARLKYTPASELNAQVSHWQDAAMKKALSINRGLRYGDAYEFIYDLQHPNPNFVSTAFVPLIERDPLKFWKVVSLISIASNLGLIYWLAR